MVNAYATDLNDRIFDTLRPAPQEMFDVTDIAIPDGSGYHPNDNPTPAMEPFEVYRDENVTVTAILVEHPPVATAFAFRFDTSEGSVTVSGDTAPTEKLVRLARDTDLLMHEAIDFDWVRKAYLLESPEAAEAGRSTTASPTPPPGRLANWPPVPERAAWPCTTLSREPRIRPSGARPLTRSPAASSCPMTLTSFPSPVPRPAPSPH